MFFIRFGGTLYEEFGQSRGNDSVYAGGTGLYGVQLSYRKDRHDHVCGLCGHYGHSSVQHGEHPDPAVEEQGLRTGKEPTKSG